MAELNIEDLGFKAVKKAPAQNTFNGIGTRLYGQSAIAGSEPLYTKVLYFTILYIPILALGKYLAYKENGAEYILGKGELSGFSKIWNALLVVVVLSFIGGVAYKSHVSSPEYIAKNLYEDATQMIEDGEFEPAITNLKSVYVGRSSLKQSAKEKIEQLMSNEFLSERSPEESFQIISNATQKTELFPQKLDIYINSFNKYETTNPVVASDFAELIVGNSTDEQQIQLYEKKNYSLLNGLYTAKPSDFGIAQRYALLDERLNRCENCLTILEPHADKLKDTESARVLGQAYANVRETEKAYRLLEPYVEKNMTRYHAAEKRYDDEIQKVWDNSIDFLNSGKAPESFYNKYDAASKENQQLMVDEYFYEQRDSSIAVENARQEYVDSASIVPVALDLGIVLLDKAAITSDLKKREALLQQAEKTFLAVQNYAGDSDDYQLYLGQVYYWLSKEDEGEKLFEALLNKYNRSHQVLNSLSNTMRNLGVFSKAREYAMEAYENAQEKADKQTYAQTVALLADDYGEKIEWLSKADQTNLYVRGDLLSAKGRKAHEENKNAQALSYLQQSIDAYEKIPESASQLNNIALIYLSKYRIGFDSSDLNAVLTNMDKAVSLAPEDSIVLGNTAFQYFTKAYLDVLSPHIDFKALETSPTLGLFSYIYGSVAQKDQLRVQLRNNSSFKKGISYIEKAALLAPKNKSFFDELIGIYSFMKDEDGLSRLVSRFDGVDLDLDGQQKRLAEYRSGASHEKSLSDSVDYITRNEISVKSPENRNNQYNQAILRSYFISTKISMTAYGHPDGSKELLALARTNYSNSVSTSTRADLESALIHYLIQSGKTELGQFAEFAKKYELILNESILFSVALDQVGTFKEYVLQSEQSKELMSLIELGMSAFPQTPNIVDWKILHELGNPKASQVAKAYQSNKHIQQQYLLGFKRTSNQEHISVTQALEQEMLGNTKEATRINQSAIERGLDVPKLSF